MDGESACFKYVHRVITNLRAEHYDRIEHKSNPHLFLSSFSNKAHQ